MILTNSADISIHTFYVGMTKKWASAAGPDDGLCWSTKTRNSVSATGIPPEGRERNSGEVTSVLNDPARVMPSRNRWRKSEVHTFSHRIPSRNSGG